MTTSPQLTLVLELCGLISRFGYAIGNNDQRSFENILGQAESLIANYRARYVTPPPRKLVFTDPRDREELNYGYPPGFFPIDDDEL